LAEGAQATATRPGVNELHVVNNKPNAEEAARILASIREAHAHADIVIVYEHQHIFDKPFLTMMVEELPSGWCRRIG